ncbi:MAG TPA: GlsB/YeaQ/YmgE family stress response membrane protein [Anaerolineae bacterium]
MGLLAWIVVGLIAGWLAGLVTKGSGFGLLGDVILGVVGALLGGFLASKIFGIADPISGFNLETIVIAFVGAVIVVVIVGLLHGGSRRTV